MTTEAEGSDFVFSFTEGGQNLRLSAWDVATGAVQKTYNCDAADGGSSCCLLGRNYLLCALRSLPFIYVWNVRKVSVVMFFCVRYQCGSLMQNYTSSQWVLSPFLPSTCNFIINLFCITRQLQCNCTQLSCSTSTMHKFLVLTFNPDCTLDNLPCKTDGTLLITYHVKPMVHFWWHSASTSCTKQLLVQALKFHLAMETVPFQVSFQVKLRVTTRSNKQQCGSVHPRLHCRYTDADKILPHMAAGFLGALQVGSCDMNSCSKHSCMCGRLGSNSDPVPWEWAEVIERQWQGLTQRTCTLWRRS